MHARSDAVIRTAGSGRRALVAGVVLVVVSLLTGALPASADPGDLDPGFSDDGVAGVSSGAEGFFDVTAGGVALGDGSVVVAGSAYFGQIGRIAIGKFTPARRPDRTFGDRGVTLVGRADRTFIVSDIARHGVGFVVAGTTAVLDEPSTDVFVARFTAAGNLDASFDGDGIRLLTFGVGTDDVGVAVGVDPTTNRIVLGGFSGNDFAVARFTSTGALDDSFSGDGRAFVASTLPRTLNSRMDLAVQANGRIVLVGDVPSPSTTDTLVARLTTAGALDGSFGVGGVRTVDVGGVDAGHSVAVSATRVVVASQSGSALGVLALTLSGTPDATFSGDGIALAPLGGNSTNPTGVAIRSTGRVVVSSISVTNPFTYWDAVEFTSAGAWNGSFATTGLLMRQIRGSGGPNGLVVTATGIALFGSVFGDMGVLDLQADGDPVDERPALLNGGSLPSNVVISSSTVVDDGEIVSVGTVGTDRPADVQRMVVVRVRADGTRVGSFGVSGVQTVGASGADLLGADVVARGGGAIAAVAVRRSELAGGAVVVALDRRGDPDLTFGVNGRVTLPVVNDVEFLTKARMTRDRRGRLVVAVGHQSGATSELTVVRLTAAGALDTSFGGDGVVTVPSTGFVFPEAIGVTASGNIVVVDSGEDRVVRLTQTGQPDPGFGVAGVLTVADGVMPQVSVGAVQPDSRVVLATNAGNDAIQVVRLRADGSPDPSFSGDGSVVVPSTPLLFLGVTAVAAQPDGRVLVTGLTEGSGGVDATSTVWRFRNDGSVDTAFGTNGARRLSMGGLQTLALDVDAQPDGDVLVTGGLRDPARRGLLVSLDGGRVARCDGRRVTVDLTTGEVPTTGDDVVRGTGRAEEIDALGGDDIVCGGGGADHLIGGRGRDLLVGEAGPDQLDGGSGVDICRGGGGIDSAQRCETREGL